MAADGKQFKSFSDWLEEGPQKAKLGAEPGAALQDYLKYLQQQLPGNPDAGAFTKDLSENIGGFVDGLLQDNQLLDVSNEPEPVPVPEDLDDITWNRRILTEGEGSQPSGSGKNTGKAGTSPIFLTLAKQKGYDDLLSAKRTTDHDDNVLPSYLGIHAPKPRHKRAMDMEIHSDSQKYFKDWWLSRAKVGDIEGLWIGLIQISRRTHKEEKSSALDKIYLGRLRMSTSEHKDIPYDKALTIDLKSDEKIVTDPEPGSDPQGRAMERLSPHYRLLKRLVKLGKIAPEVWNPGKRPVFTAATWGKKPTTFQSVSIDRELLASQKSWHRAGCFYGFYWLLRHGRPTWGRLDLVSSALNWYANGTYGNFVPKDGSWKLKGQPLRAYTSYCSEVRTMGLERDELVRDWWPEGADEGAIQRSLVGANWRGTKVMPLEWARNLIFNLQKLASTIKK